MEASVHDILDAQSLKRRPNEDYASFRKRRHRATEAIRRRRINDSLTDLKTILSLDKHADQATILDAAVRRLEQLEAHQRDAQEDDVSIPMLDEADLAAVFDNLSQPSPADSIESGRAPSTNSFLAGEHDPLGLFALPPLDLTATNSTATDLATANLSSADLSLSLLPLPTLQSSSFGRDSQLPSQPGLESRFLPSNISIIIVTNTFVILDMNKAGAELLGLPAPQDGVGKLGQDLLSPVSKVDYGNAMVELMAGQRHSFSKLSLVRVSSNQRELWLKTTHTCLDQTPDAMGLRRMIVIAQPVEAPADGLAKILD
eukprot:TRINITY_DN4255_c0_g1_i1.p1 TRINITY_DN4255_c0_g1~~TRINITY_DN4255_c0_g1_i1.p1  ORF type:complete len:315 (+),score=58.22 TRINITY_DN4255_c0_g1_i1:189-1133(+)